MSVAVEHLSRGCSLAETLQAVARYRDNMTVVVEDHYRWLLDRMPPGARFDA